MAWLLGDGAARLTGQVIAVDGGFTTVRPLVKWAEKRGCRPALHPGAGEDSIRRWPGDVSVSAIVKDLTPGADIRHEPHGVYALKGVPGEWVLRRAL